MNKKDIIMGVLVMVVPKTLASGLGLTEVLSFVGSLAQPLSTLTAVLGGAYLIWRWKTQINREKSRKEIEEQIRKSGEYKLMAKDDLDVTD